MEVNKTPSIRYYASQESFTFMKSDSIATFILQH